MRWGPDQFPKQAQRYYDGKDDSPDIFFAS
jgi:hypothetical protein